MSRFTERLERDLNHIADRATPSPTAWEAIQTRAADQADHPELEITMLKPNPEPNRPIRAWILGAAAAVLLIGGVLFIGLNGGDDATLLVADNDTPTTTESPTSAPTPLVLADAQATIEEFLAVTDSSALSAVLIDPALATSTDAEEWLMVRELLGVKVEVLSCAQAGSASDIRCSVSVSSNITEGFRQEPAVRDITFNFTNGQISTWPVVTVAGFDGIREFAAGVGDEQEYDAMCQALTTDCAEFVTINLDAWVGAATGAGRVTIEGSIDVDLIDGELTLGVVGRGSFEVTSGAATLGCAAGTVEETYITARVADKVMTCTSGKRAGTFTIRITDSAQAGGRWEVTSATGDFVELAGNGGWTGDGEYSGRETTQDPVLGLVWVAESQYTDRIEGPIAYE